MAIKRFEEIKGWQSGRQLSRLIYQLTRKGDFKRDFGLVDQIRRASGSVMHNIAEGFDCGSNADFIRFLRYSQRSGSEVQSELYIALDQAYISEEEFQAAYDLADEAKNKVGAFIAYLLGTRKDKST